VFAWAFPLLNVFFSIMWVFLWVLWIFLVIRIVVDIFRSHDLGGLGKAAWMVFVCVFPFLGVFVYVLARGRTMHDRNLQAAQDQEQRFREYVQTAASGGPADELSKLADLRDRKVITQEEFDQEKARVLAHNGSATGADSTTFAGASH